MKQVEVTILGQSYILGCPEDGERELLQAVAMVDREMSTIRDAGKIKARERIAVLAALNLAYRLAEHESRAQVASSGATSGASAAATSAASAPSAGTVGPSGASPLGAGDELGRDVVSLISRLDALLAEDGRLL